MKLEDVKPGIKIKTNKNLNSTKGMLIKQPFLDQRESNKEGMVYTYVPGHGGDVWWIRHRDGSLAPYVFDEFEPIEGYSL